ncbi:MAG: 4-(cytidine 5'-diphospho)-2-C-methyl-D-erythritol kinase [Candidatus Pelagibacter sp.]|jgi:4-diphosphocytidyl-2-C-methyl-D-erythritol kinase
MSYIKIKSHAKINLALNIVGKTKKLHKIESIVSFLDLHDEIRIKKINQKNNKIKFFGKFSKGIKSKNTVSELLKNIEKKKLFKEKFQITIKKNIPSEAGLGGGSMNAASVLNFFIKEKLLKRKKEILEIANAIGSDVVLGLYKKNLVLKSNNEIKVIPSKKKFNILLVKPSFGCSTKRIYSKVKKFYKPEFNTKINNLMRSDFLREKKNDLEPIAIESYPKLKILKDFLDKLPNTEFVRMTGSGSTIIAYFNSLEKCKEASKKVSKQFRNYWCKTSKTI